MSSNAIRNGKIPDAPQGIVPAGLTGQQQRRTVVCLDWVAYNSCTFVCPHCHPKDGLTRRAKMLKAYYILAGTASDQAGVYLLNAEQASEIAKLIVQEKLYPGFAVIRTQNSFAIADTKRDDSFTQVLDTGAIRVFFYDMRLAPLPENMPMRLWWGRGFSGIGCIQYHEDVALTVRDAEARTAGYSRQIIEKFVNEDLQRHGESEKTG